MKPTDPSDPDASDIFERPERPEHSDVPRWEPAAIPTWTPVRPGEGTAEPAATYRLPSDAFRNAVWALVAVVVVTLAASAALSALADTFRAGTLPRFLVGAASLAAAGAIDLVALYVFATRRGVRTRDLGLTVPNDKPAAVVLAASTWLVFLFAAATWVLVTTPRDEIRAQESVFSNRTDNSDAVADDPSGGSTDGVNSPVSPVIKTPRDDRHVLIKVLQDDPPVRVLVIIVVAACIIAPLVEELFFRGFLFAATASRFGVRSAILFTGGLFGLAHLSVVPIRILPVLGILGMALAWLRHQTRSLLPGMAVHAFVNALATGISADFGLHTLTLIAGSWIVLFLLVLPIVRRNTPLQPVQLLHP